MHHSHAIIELADAQHGVATARQLGRAGLDKDAIARMVRKGWLSRAHRGVYAVGRHELTRDGTIMAAVLACGRGAAASHLSAGHLLDLRRHDWGDPHVVVPRTGAHGRHGVRVHVGRALATVRVRGIPCTDPVRTLTDLADVLDAAQLALAVTTAERRELVDRHAARPLPAADGSSRPGRSSPARRTSGRCSPCAAAPACRCPT